jgi:hypothetical protein
MGGTRPAKPDRDRIAPPPEMAALREATAGLVYPSESDAPFDVFIDRTATTAQEVVTHRSGGGRVKSVAVEQFFAELEASDQADQYRRLRDVLEKNLSPLGVFRVGSVQVDVYLVGKTSRGCWVGLHTRSVET